MEINFTNKIVAFIDVLGFKNLVLSKDVTLLETYFEYVTTELQKYIEENNFEYLLISDSIIVYCNYNTSFFINLIQIISMIQAKLLCSRIIIRGGISFGNLFVDKEENIIVGEALVNAYSLENEAKFPRVIIDRRFLKDDLFRKSIRLL